MPLPKVIVIGASGNVGKATLQALVARHRASVQVFAGVRDPAKLAPIDGVTAIPADLGNKAHLTEMLRGFDRVLVVTPGHADRTQLAINGLEASAAAGVKFVSVISVLTVGTDSIFGRQFKAIEDAARAGSVPYSIVRLPLFVDNNWANAGSIKSQNTFYDPRDPTAQSTAVVVSDAGKAIAEILAHPEKHANTTYKLVSPPFTLHQLAAAFSAALGKTITVTPVPYDAAKSSFLGAGYPEWQVDGTLELFKFIDSKSPITNEADLTHIEKITGEKATTIEQWTKQVAAGFQP